MAGEFTVAWVYDGDTIKAEGQDITIKIRLVGIDASEICKKRKTQASHIVSKQRSISRD